jgi:hypothetical protein
MYLDNQTMEALSLTASPAILWTLSVHEEKENFDEEDTLKRS